MRFFQRHLTPVCGAIVFVTAFGFYAASLPPAQVPGDPGEYTFIPWVLGIAHPPAVLRGDVGVLLSDPTGSVTVERIYHFNKNTSVVADIPTEVRIQPAVWQPLP